VGLGPAPPGLHDAQLPGVPVRLGGGAGQHPVTVEQPIDLARQPQLAAGQQDEVIGHPLQLGQRVRGQQHGHAVVGHRRQHRGHEVLPGQWVEHGQRLVEDEQPWPPGQRHGQRELRLLAAGQLAHLLAQRDAELAQPGLRVWLVGAPVQVPGQVQYQRDASYFAPLADLAAVPGTELNFALVPYHPADQAPGTTAEQVRLIDTGLAASPGGSRAWGVSTECGMGRVDREDIPVLLDLHREIITAGLVISRAPGPTAPVTAR
jgi:hypothetical protein